MPERGASPDVLELDHVSITTRDLDASVAFYADLLGLSISARGASEDEEIAVLMNVQHASIRWADIEIGDGRILELLEFLDPVGRTVTRSPWDPGATHVGLRVRDIDAVHDRLVEANICVVSKPVRLTEDGSWHGARVMYAIDPDGTWVELVERRGSPT